MKSIESVHILRVITSLYVVSRALINTLGAIHCNSSVCVYIYILSARSACALLSRITLLCYLRIIYIYIDKWIDRHTCVCSFGRLLSANSVAITSRTEGAGPF